MYAAGSTNALCALDRKNKTEHAAAKKRLCQKLCFTHAPKSHAPGRSTNTMQSLRRALRPHSSLRTVSGAVLSRTSSLRLLLDGGERLPRPRAPEAAAPPEADRLHPARAVVRGQAPERPAGGRLHGRGDHVLLHGLHGRLGGCNKRRPRLVQHDLLRQLLDDPAASLLHGCLVPVVLHGRQRSLHRAMGLDHFLHLDVVHARAKKRPTAGTLYVRRLCVRGHSVEYDLHTSARYNCLLVVGVASCQIPEHPAAQDLDAWHGLVVLHGSKNSLDAAASDDVLLVGGAVGGKLTQSTTTELLDRSHRWMRRHRAKHSLDATVASNLGLAIAVARCQVAQDLATHLLQGLPVRELGHCLHNDLYTIELKQK
mmetsp:Transcript_132017/g.329307  ORF Transcript_132017/g.329307 Transcript_132017/m.329307 type:complete len:369 (+) Transcript_132017:193-1299(+)